MLTKLVKVGDKIELRRAAVAELNAQAENKTYYSKIMDFADDTALNISVPMENGHLIPLEIGGRFDMRIISLSGMYVCKCVIENRYKMGNLYYMVARIVTDLKKDQRRQYFRVDKIIPLTYHVFSEEEDNLRNKLYNEEYRNDREKWEIQDRLAALHPVETEGTISNISGGGVKFSSGEALEKNQKLALHFQMDPNDPGSEMEMFARVVMTDEVRNRNMMYEHRLEFININRETREKIVRFVFKEERKQRQNQ